MPPTPSRVRFASRWTGDGNKVDGRAARTCVNVPRASFAVSTPRRPFADKKTEGARAVTAPLFQFLVRIGPDRPGPRRVGGAMDPDVLVSHLDDFRDVLIKINDDVSALEPDTRPVTPRVDRAPNQAPPRLKTLLGDPARPTGKTRRDTHRSASRSAPRPVPRLSRTPNTPKHSRTPT